MNRDHTLEAERGAQVPAWLTTSIALVRLREAGDEVTDVDVFEECEFVGIDPTPVMILVQRKAPAAWPASLEDVVGRHRIVGQRVIGLWFDLVGRDHVAIDTPQAQEALDILLKITGMPAPRTYPLSPLRTAIYPWQIPDPGHRVMPRAGWPKASPPSRGRGRRSSR